MRILIVDDDSRVARTVGLGLRDAGYDVEHAADGNRALALAATGACDAVVLDLVLPDGSGLDVLRELRVRGVRVPVLILTAKGQMHDRVTGLDAGADDYLVKPFGLEELVARIRALLRRRGDMLQTVLRVRDVELDTLRRRATRAGNLIDLTNREFELLEFLLRHANEVVSRASLLEHVWGYHFDTMSNLVDVHIAHLRSKLDDGFEPKLLHTVRGQGYVLRAEAPSAGPGSSTAAAS